MLLNWFISTCLVLALHSVPIATTGKGPKNEVPMGPRIKGVRVFDIKQSAWVIILTQTHVSLMLTHQIDVFSVGFQVKFCVKLEIWDQKRTLLWPGEFTSTY